MTPIPPDAAEQLTAAIVNCGGEAASALVDLLYAVADPSGDKHRYEIAWIAIRKAMPSVPEYDQVIIHHCERARIKEVKSMSG